MKVSGSYTVPISRDQAYPLLQDPVILARCMPGTDRLDKIGPDEYEMKMKLAIASFSGLFNGKIRIAEAEPPDSFKLLVEGTGKIGFLKGEGVLRLLPVEGSTDVQYDGDVQIGGTIAAVGQRLLDSTSKMIIKKFFEKFTEQVTQTS